MQGGSMKIALVTGANKGIGKEIAKGLIARGVTVYMGARDETRGTQAAKELGGKFLHLDVTSPESIAKAAASLPALDILVNNAGQSSDTGMSIQDVTPETLRKTFDTNYFGVIAVTKAMLPLLRKSQHKAIVNVSSALGSLALFQNSEWAYSGITPYAYNSSKTALNMFTVLLAKELRSEGFRINAVNPGYVATDLNNNQGPGTPADGARIAIQAALLGPDGPTGSFMTWEGTLPW
jgi:NAD(P)-dependent dehydrogenase (short-subunit alcohol dehydrogenase family)